MANINLTVMLINLVVKNYSHINLAHVQIAEEAIRLGYIRRLSATQIEWSEQGLEKAKKELAEQ